MKAKRTGTAVMMRISRAMTQAKVRDTSIEITESLHMYLYIVKNMASRHISSKIRITLCRLDLKGLAYDMYMSALNIIADDMAS